MYSLTGESERISELWRQPGSETYNHTSLKGWEFTNDVINIDQFPIGNNSRSNPANYIGLFDSIRMLFRKTGEAMDNEYTISNFSFIIKIVEDVNIARVRVE